MKFNLIGSTAHLNISSGNAARYIKRLDIPGLRPPFVVPIIGQIDIWSIPKV